ncbi:MAG: hypothetical protein GX320_06950 [Tissierellia bacterium]|nr:hypothetical protein [Tissierellia bacterium]
MNKKTISFVLILVIMTLAFAPMVDASSNRLLRLGSRGSDVRTLQQRLNSLGYNCGNADGIFGTRTYNAVRAFQSKNGLAVDGIVGKDTRSKLFSGSTTPSRGGTSTNSSGNTTSTSKSAPITGLLRRGSRGSQVVTLQNRLNQLGYNCGKADGIFGTATYNAVVKFQRANGLAVDGIVGNATISKLYSGSTAPSKGGTTTKPPSNTTPTSKPAPITGLLRRGSRGSQVTTLQNRLNQLGYNCGKADGIFGTATYNAVVRFQRAKGLAVDGIVGKATIAKLYPQTSTPTPPKPTPTPPAKPEPKPQHKPPANNVPLSGLIRMGDRGSQVTILQKRLNELGYDAGKADGIFGTRTYNAVRAFQRAKGLAVDGIVGKATIAKLYPPKHDPGLNDFVEFDVKAGSLKGKTVIIDAGHGGSDPGASRDGYHEKTFTFDMADRLQRMLRKAGAEVIMTRSGDVNRTLQYRANVANKKVLDEEIKRVNGEIAEIEKEMKPFMEDVDSLKARIAELTNEITELKEELNKVKESNSNQESIDDLQIQNEESQARLNELEETNSLDQETMECLQAEIDQKQEELTKLKEMDESNQDAMENLQTEINQKQDEIVTLGETNKLNEEKIVELTNELNKGQAELATLQKTNEPDQDKIAELEGEIEQKEKELKDANDELAKLMPLQSDLDKLNAELAELNQLIGKYASLTGGNRLKPANEDLVNIFDRSKNYDNIIFISIHNNSTGAITQTGASGIRVYYRPTIVADNDGQPSKVYYDGYNDDGRKLFAEMLNQEMQAKSVFSQKTNKLYNRNDLAVLREQNLVSALVEVGFMNNPNDLALLRRQQTREDMAAGMYRGIGKYFGVIR